MGDPIYAGGAGGYDELFARATQLFIPALLDAAHLGAASSRHRRPRVAAIE
jgi:hypothetical protein